MISFKIENTLNQSKLENSHYKQAEFVKHPKGNPCDEAESVKHIFISWCDL